MRRSPPGHARTRPDQRGYSTYDVGRNNDERATALQVWHFGCGDRFVSASVHTAVAVAVADTLAAAALVVSVVSVRYVRRGVRAAERTDNREAARRHDELAPQFAAMVEAVNDNQLYRLVLSLTSPRPLTFVQIQIPERSGVSFTIGQNGVVPGTRPPVLVAEAMDRPDDNATGRSGTPGMRPGEAARWQIDLHEKRPLRTALTIIARAGREEWTVPDVWLVVPPDYSNAVH